MLNERFWSKVNKNAPGDCWEWSANKNNNGYGMFSCRALGFKHKKLAHRLSYQHFNGPIPKGSHILHSCDNPSCVNPSHLRPGSRSDNMRDSVSRKRHGNLKVSDETIISILKQYAARIPRKTIAKNHNIPLSSISDYLSLRTRPWLIDHPDCPRADLLKAAKQTKPSAILDERTVLIIRERLAGGEVGKALAEEYGIHKATISDIKLRKIWRDI